MAVFPFEDPLENSPLRKGALRTLICTRAVLTNYSGGINYGLQFQVWPCPEIIHVAVTAVGASPRELINRHNQLQKQLLIPVELITRYSYRTGLI